MRIISKHPNPSGAYPPVQSRSDNVLPNGYYEIVADMIEFDTHNGFVTLMLENGIVTGFVPNIEAWEAWKVSLPPPHPPEPSPDEDRDALSIDHEYRLALLELGVN